MNEPVAAADLRLDEVRAVLDREIRPRLAAHLGSAEIDRIDDDGIVHLLFTGACTSCAYRKVTLLGAVYPRLREIDGIEGVASPGVPVSLSEQQRVAATLDRYERR